MGARTLAFSDRVMMLLRATPTQLATALDVLDDLAELRHPRRLAETLAMEPAAEQAEWVQDVLQRTQPSGENSPVACIVDTGVHQAHPLLEHSLQLSDCHACDPAWNVTDHHGHGTEMAGLALYGDVGAALTPTVPYVCVTVSNLSSSFRQPARTPKNSGVRSRQRRPVSLRSRLPIGDESSRLQQPPICPDAPTADRRS